MADPEIKAECLTCGESLARDHVGPCPNCGNEGKRVTVSLYDKISITDSLKTTKIKKEVKYIVFVLIFSITIIFILNLLTSHTEFNIFYFLLFSAFFCLLEIIINIILNVITRDSRRVKDFRKEILKSYNEKLDSSLINPNYHR